MQATGRQPHRAPVGGPFHYERHRPEQTTLYRLVQQHAATFFAQAEDAAGADLPQFVKDEFDAFLECGILAHGFLRLHCGGCGHDKLVAFSCKRRGFCPSCGDRRMAQTAPRHVEHVIPHLPVRQWVLSLPISLRLLLAAQPKLVTPLLQVVHRRTTQPARRGQFAGVRRRHDAACNDPQRLSATRHARSFQCQPRARQRQRFSSGVSPVTAAVRRQHGHSGSAGDCRSGVRKNCNAAHQASFLLRKGLLASALAYGKTDSPSRNDEASRHHLSSRRSNQSLWSAALTTASRLGPGSAA